MSDAGQLAKTLNEKLDALHDQVVNEDPFSWSDSEKDREDRAEAFRDISKKLNAFSYVPKTGTIVKILLLGTALPLVLLAVLYLTGVPAEGTMRLWVWGGLAVIAAASAIIAAVVADNPDIASDLALAAYAIPKGWSFSCHNSSETWEAYSQRFDYFDQGDENRYIGTRIWGYPGNDRKRPFQLFHFHYDEVRWETEVYTDSKGNSQTRQVRRVYPHNRYGMFITMPESKARFRITEICGDAGMDAHIKLEYNALNKAVNVYCESKDELAVRQFLSPAVQETVMRLSNDIDDMHLDFYPGLVLIAAGEDFLNKVVEIELDGQAPRFLELVRPAGNRIDEFRTRLTESFDKIRKYNDNY